MITRLMHAADKKLRRKMTGPMKYSQKYKEAMDLVELWVLLKTQNDEHRYNIRQLTQLQRQFTHVTTNVNETENTTGLRSA